MLKVTCPFSPVEHVTIDLILFELLSIFIRGDSKHMNRSSFWRFYHDLILVVNRLSELCLALGILQHILTLLKGEGKGKSEVIVIILKKGDFEMQLGVILFGLSKNINIQIASPALLDPSPRLHT